jgi:spermidine synthase
MARFRESISGSVWLSELQPLITINGPLQNVAYYSSRKYGRALVIDGELQHVEAWAPFYHELIVHLPCSFLQAPARALIIGGGSLFAAEELLKYDTVKLVDLVDYDSNVIRATVDAYPERAGILHDRRLNIIEQKYQSFLIECKTQYNIIINDCFDLYSVSKASGIDYYALIESLMADDGICSDLVYRSIYDELIVGCAIRRIPNHLYKAISLVAVPEYPGILHVLTMWGKSRSLRQNQTSLSNRNQIEMSNNALFSIYDPKFLAFYLYSPPYLSKYII